MSPLPPVLLQVHSEIAGDYHSSSVRHKTSEVHFSHERIDQRHSGPTCAPSLDDIFVGFPAVELSIINAILREYLVPISHAPVSVEVPPKQIVNENFS